MSSKRSAQPTRRLETGSMGVRYALSVFSLSTVLLSSCSAQQRVVEAPIGESTATQSAPDTPLEHLAVVRADRARMEADDPGLQHSGGYGIPWVAPAERDSTSETHGAGTASEPAHDNAAVVNGSPP